MTSGSRSIVQGLKQRFENLFDAPPDLISRAPGRVNLIGDHTDYNGGYTLSMTLDRAVYVAIRRRLDDRVQVQSMNLSKQVRWSLDALPKNGSNWHNYVAGVTSALHLKGFIPSGFEAVIVGDVPLGSGLSSSAALEVALLVGLQGLFEFDMNEKQAAFLCQQVEHDYIGVQCGIMDQFTSRLGKEDHAIFLDCQTLQYQEVPIYLGEESLLIVDSTVQRALADSAYNKRRRECKIGEAFFENLNGAKTTLRDVTPSDLEALDGQMDETILKRCQHVVDENQRVILAAKALRQGNMKQFGMLMNASHNSLRDLYEVSCHELDVLVDAARQSDAVLGARMTGAGFGGCVVALVKKAAADEICMQIASTYNRVTGLDADFYRLEHNVRASIL